MGFFSKKREDSLEYDREREYPVLRCSICNGEQVAGFKDRSTGHFREITLIRSEEEKAAFMRRCKVTELSKEY